MVERSCGPGRALVDDEDDDARPFYSAHCQFTCTCRVPEVVDGELGKHESTLRQRDPSFMMPILLVAVEPNRGLFVVTQTAPALWIARDGCALRIDARGHLLVAIKGT